MHERRNARRVIVPGLRVTYEIAGGVKIETEAVNVSAHGGFLYAERPPPVGERIPLEFCLAEGTGWSALGQVAWVRHCHRDVGLPGMGVELVDLEDAAAEAIERLLRGLVEDRHLGAMRIRNDRLWAFSPRMASRER